MFIDEDTLYSYGRHFPLAVRYASDGDHEFLINGDRYSVTTACHQSQCFRLGPQVPFSALRAADIDPYRLRIVDHTEDEWHDVPDPTPEDPENVRREHTLGAVVLEHRDRFFLSSMDENESWRLRSYFLCELPVGAGTVSAAYESLVPDRVKAWREDASGPRDERQGEWFFLPTDHETRHLPAPSYRNAQLLDTNHYVTELRRNHDLFCRGTSRHMPANRRPQHRMLKLGRTWHVAVKNLAVASWNAIGGVD